ncbi:MAG: IMP dehydrogenase [Desulfurococcales archaeon]|nr:IMP dehydrogenase [Desulfurococcales archaeon]
MAGNSSVVGEVLTFDDVIIVPGKSPVEPRDVELSSRVTRRIWISIPLVSSPMDTVTEWRMALILARLGAVGVIHRNMSVDEQAMQVRRVKESPPSPWYEVAKSTPEEPLSHLDFRLSEIGVGAAVLFEGSEFKGVYVAKGVRGEFWLKKAEAIAALVSSVKPIPSIDEEGRPRVGAAVSPYDVKRAKALEEAGADFLVVDVAHIHNVNALRGLRQLVKDVSIDVVVGNLGTREAVLDVISVAEDVGGLRAGIASGSICTTGEVTGASMPTLTAVMNAFDALKELGAEREVPIIADGGVRNAGDAAKALIAGASSVMVGRMLAGTEEAPGSLVSVGGRLYKQYRGMASRSAIERRHASDRYAGRSKLIEEGVEGLVPYRGSVAEVLLEFAAGLQAALGYAGASNVGEAWKAKLARVTQAGLREIKPHDIVLG